MKIRNYKGSSLEKIYDAIRNELGPEAVVIPVKTPDKKSLLRPLAGGGQYEVVAVAEDASADKHVMDLMASAQGLQAGPVNDKQLGEMKRAINDIGVELRALTGGAAGGGRGDRSLPEFARDWDERFVHKLKAESPDIFSDKNRDELKIQTGKALNIRQDFAVGAKRPHVIVFVGPTGSGKTTTLAKLAAIWALDEKLKIGVITTDTFRVAAVDQVKEYAALLAVDVAVAFSAAEAAAAVEKFADKDVILVDTPGRNHYDQMGLAGIRGILQGMGPVTVMLHVPAILHEDHVSDLLANFQMLHPDYIVVTKVDETKRYGVFTSIACNSKCPVAFITDGQRVPQDIHSAALDRLVNILVPDVIDKSKWREKENGRSGIRVAQSR